MSSGPTSRPGRPSQHSRKRKRRNGSTEEISPARLALRYGPRALLAVTIPLVAISWAVAGWRAAAGGAAGLLVVAGFFTISVVLVEGANRVHPSMTLPVALTEYSVKVIVLGAVAFAIPDSWGSARPAFAIGLIVGTLAVAGQPGAGGLAGTAALRRHVARRAGASAGRSVVRDRPHYLRRHRRDSTVPALWDQQQRRLRQEGAERCGVRTARLDVTTITATLRGGIQRPPCAGANQPLVKSAWT